MANQSTQEKPAEKPEDNAPNAPAIGNGGGGNKINGQRQPDYERAGSRNPPREFGEQHVNPRPVVPFIVEMGDHKCSGMIIVDHLHLKLRGRWDRTKLNGTSELIHRLPAIIPGVQIRVNPRDRVVVIYDPLTDQPEIIEECKRAYEGDENVTIRDASGSGLGKPYPTTEYRDENMDEHLFKSLLLEISRKTLSKNPEGNSMICVKGQVPTEYDLREFPGRELYDPWSNNPDRPRFVDQLDIYRDRLRNAQAAARD